MTTKDEALKLAREAGLQQDGENFFSPNHDEVDVHITDLQRFAKLIAEDCAKIANEAEPYQSADLIRKKWAEMKCPTCQAWTVVKETRQRKEYTYRRYECANLHRFTTEERICDPAASTSAPACRQACRWTRSGK